MTLKRIKLVRITTVPISLKYLITGQMEYMSSKGFDVVMMSADGQERHEVIANENCEHIVIPLTREITPLKDLRALWILYRQLRSLKPNIVHTHTPKAGIVGMIAAWMARVPVRIHTVAGLPLQTAIGKKRWLLENIEKLTYSFATQVWPNSNSLYNFIVKENFAKPSKLKVIGKGSSNGIDISEFDKKTLDENVLADIKDKIKYSDSNRYLLFVGRVVKDKGIEELVEAFLSIKKKYNNLKLIIVGPVEHKLDPLSVGITQNIENDDDIITTGFSSLVKYYMYLADLFVFPSHREGFPNVPMQAALMDCPVIASRITGNTDIVDDRENGILHTVSDSDSLESSIEFALDHPDDMTRMAAKLKEKVINNFDRRVIQEKILNEYTICL